MTFSATPSVTSKSLHRSTSMRIILAGGSGQIGTMLTRRLLADGHDVVILSRSQLDSPARVRAWDGQQLGQWADEIDGADVLINLAGRSVNCRYNKTNRDEILHSRIKSTEVLGQAIAVASHPPRVWLQSSTATIYAHRYDAANDEATGIIAGDEPDAPDTWRFSIDVAKAWEQAAVKWQTPSTRQVLMRTAMVMSPDRGGVFDILLGLVRRGLGGPVAGGQQFMSWIHETDFLRAVYWLIDQDVSGAVNVSSPNPLPHRQFMQSLRQAWGIRIGLPANRWMLELGTLVMRTESELILKSRRVIPGRLLQSGFSFEFPDWPHAARDLCRRWREDRHAARRRK